MIINSIALRYNWVINILYSYEKELIIDFRRNKEVLPVTKVRR